MIDLVAGSIQEGKLLQLAWVTMFAPHVFVYPPTICFVVSRQLGAKSRRYEFISLIGMTLQT